MSVIATLGVLAASVLAAYAVPAIVLGLVWPRIEAGTFLVTNYRGIRVAPVLWIAFPVWAVALVVLRLAAHALQPELPGPLGVAATPQDLLVLVPLWPMVGVALGVMVFGILDDVWGGHDAKGFRGHLGSLLHGRITTGGLKILGIGVVAFTASLYTTMTDRVGTTRLPGGPSVLAIAVATVLGTLVVALSANTVNLADLRPGRALKVSGVLLVLAMLSIGALCVREGLTVAGTAFVVALVAVLVGGPMLSMWPYDVRERGMLGDGGANALGALVGYVIFAGLAPAAANGVGSAIVVLGGVAGLLLLVNVVSERISYSELIERNDVLRRLDRLGRPSFEDAIPEPTPRDT